MNSSFYNKSNPNLFSFTAAVVGAIAVGDFDSYELNSIGNWLILVGQYILTFAAEQQLIESRIDKNNININSKRYKSGGSPYTNGKSNQTQREEVEYLLKAVSKLEKELETIKNNF